MEVEPDPWPQLGIDAPSLLCLGCYFLVSSFVRGLGQVAVVGGVRGPGLSPWAGLIQLESQQDSGFTSVQLSSS